MTRSGDRCGACKKGNYDVYSMRRFQGVVVRYLKCRSCGKTEKSVVSVQEVRKRSRFA